MVRFISVIMMVLVCGLGCAHQQPAASSSSGQNDDNNLNARIYTRLADDPVTAPINVGVQSSDGIVTLTGRIDQPAARMRVLSVVRGTAGVRGVVDKTFRY